MYQILLGIPAMPTSKYRRNKNGCIEDLTLEDDESLWCDFAILYAPETSVYKIKFETALAFSEPENCRKWIEKCFACFTDYMVSHKLFTQLEDVYAFMKFVVNGFHGNGIDVEELELW